MIAHWSFLLRIAWRDSRKDRSRMLLFMSSIMIGVAALVAINSFNDNLIRDIDTEAKSLLGADLQLSANQKLTDEIAALFDSIPGESSVVLDLFSMSYLPKTDESQFVRIKAIDGGFPYYGKIKTDPVAAARDYQNDQTILVDEGMMVQYDLQVGDSIRIGQRYMTIGGRLQSLFGSISMGSSFAPAVYITPQLLDESQLIQPGSMIDYSYYKKTDADVNIDEWNESHEDDLRNDGYRTQTVTEQKEDLDAAFSNLNYFLNLVALVSLILGCIGVASSVLIYIRNKRSSIAILRCLGMQSSDAFSVYFIQILMLGLASVVIGAAIGTAVQVFLPEIFQDILPYEVTMTISWKAVTEGIVIGLIVTMLFALIPLINIRRVSPLETLRISDEGASRGKDWLTWLVYVVIVLSLMLFLWRLTGSIQDASVYIIGLLVAFGILFVIARSVMWVVRKFYPGYWPYVWRQGLSNLYRPNNQTVTLIVSIGLGTAILTTLFIIQGLLLRNVQSMDAGDQANMILFGIESEQVDALRQITHEFEMPVIQEVPIVTMKLAGWQGKTKDQWLADSSRQARRWVINREARVTFRDSLESDEKLIKGEYIGQVSPGDSIWISVSDGFADGLGVDIGDEIVWNVQGALITTYVGSIREIDFRSMRTRFLVLFPKGVLERAPQFHVIVTKSPDTNTTARYRSTVVKAFANISVIDLGMILTTVNEIVTKVSYIIQFMAGFSILTGIIVLLSSLLLSKYQRIRESVLLRTLGAVRGQILRINFVEYLLLGGLAAITGITISIAGSFLLARYQLELDFVLNWWPIVLIFLIVVVSTVLIGLFNSREVLNKSPLEVLRRD